jgi:glycine hydroxymethyltransferase
MTASPSTARPPITEDSAPASPPGLADDVSEAWISVLPGGTEVHLVLVDLRASAPDGRQAEDRLHRVGITVSRDAVPFDPRPPMVSSGPRIGTPAPATRGFGAEAFREVADIVALTLKDDLTDERAVAPRGRVSDLAAAFPLHTDLDGIAG